MLLSMLFVRVYLHVSDIMNIIGSTSRNVSRELSQLPFNNRFSSVLKKVCAHFRVKGLPVIIPNHKQRAERPKAEKVKINSSLTTKYINTADVSENWRKYLNPSSHNSLLKS